MFNKKCTIYISLLCALIVLPCRAQFPQITIDPEHKTPGIEKIEQALQSAIGTRTLPESLEVDICAGSQSFENCLATSNHNVLGIFISSTTFLHATRSKPEATSQSTGKLSAIFSDPSPDSMIALARSMVGQNKTISIALSPYSESLKNYLTESNVEIIYTENRKLGRWLRRIRGSALVAIPDINIYNQSSIRTIVKHLYTTNRPLIGYNSSMVKAGSLATITISDEQLTESLITYLKNLHISGRLPPPSFINSNTAYANKRLAQSLSVSLPEDEFVIEDEADL